jgi:ligand-binding sensor domain-containing protein
MKKYSWQTRCFIFLTVSIIGTSCNGQIQKDLPKEKVSETKIVSDGQLKLTKTQGSQKGDNVNSSLQDKAGNLWFGTSNNGLYKYDGKSFSQFLVTDGLNSNNIYCILEDKDGKIWIGTQAGLCLYDGKTFAKIQIPLRKNQPPNKNDLYRNSHWVFSITQAKSGKLWFATIDGVYIYDGKSFTPFIVNEGGGGFGSSNNNVEHILEDKAGNIWFGGRGNEGVYRYDGKSVINIKLKILSSIPDSIRNGKNWAWPQLQDKNGNIWFSNWGGAYRYDGKSFTGFTKKEGLSVDVVTRIIEDSKGNLWFGGAGLCRYDGKSFTHFTVKDGVINSKIGSFMDVGKGNDVWSILEDRTGNLWIGTKNTGLYRFDGKSFTSFSE